MRTRDAAWLKIINYSYAAGYGGGTVRLTAAAEHQSKGALPDLRQPSESAEWIRRIMSGSANGEE